MNILVTGGPVHAYLDPVKIITNRFKGGMMVEITEKLAFKGHTVTYLCAKGMRRPAGDVNVVEHNGFDDYRQKVTELAPEMDAVVLGAAVANLIPAEPFKEKFPSHNYKPGDIIPIDFTIAPRVIDEVKRVMKRTAHLFGFKLLAGHSHEELIRAAYEVLLESRATCVFANDASSKDSLMTKYAVMKDRSVHEMSLDDVASFISRILDDEYYRTDRVNTVFTPDMLNAEGCAVAELQELIESNGKQFVETEAGYIFGTVAVRVGGTNSFYTTYRGKREIDGYVLVVDVNHDNLQIQATNKATLNAPLLHWVFSMYPEVHSILHFHNQEDGLPVYPYAPPGTKRDSVRGLPCKSFNIDGHGCFLLRDEKGEVIR